MVRIMFRIEYSRIEYYISFANKNTICYYNIDYEYHMDSFTNNYVYFLMRLLIAGEGSRDRVWGPVFTRCPVQFRQKKISKLYY